MSFCLAKRLVLIAVVLTGSMRAWAASAGDYRPQYTIDLRKFGYREPEEKWTRFQILPTNSVTFVDNNTLAISLFTPNAKPGLSVRGEVFGGHYLFQTTFIEARSGEVLRTQQWSNSEMGCGIFGAAHGRFVVWHDLELSLRAPDGATIKTLTLDSKNFPRAASITQSPSGDILFAKRADRDGDHVLVIRTADLQEITWLDFPGYFADAGSDSYFAFLRPRHGPDSVMDLFVRRIAGQDSKSLEPKRIFTTEGPGCFSVVFVDERTLGVSGNCRDVTLLSTSGELQYHRHFAQALTATISGCRSCDLLFFSTYVLVGGSTFRDTFPKAKSKGVVLLNRRTGRQVEWQRKTPIKHPRGGSTALSPDGCALAIQNDWYLEVYRICGSSLGKKLQMGQAAD
jgi:hypothetical protein